MLFDARHFEQVFSEQALKKGLRLFERGKTELIKRQSPDFEFDSGGEKVQLRKRADRVLSYDCTCTSKFPCEHLASVLFFLQQDKLSLPKTKRPGKENNKRKKTNAAHLFSQHFSQFSGLIKDYLAVEQLTASGRSALLSDVMVTERNLSALGISTLITDLVLVSGLSPLYSGSVTSQAPGVHQIFIEAETRLRHSSSKTMSRTEKEAWLLAAAQSLRSGKVLHSGAFTWLVPRALLLTKDLHVVTELMELTEKRKMQKAFHEGFNRLLVVKCMIALRLKELKQGRVPGRLRNAEPEYSIAIAEFNFLKRHSQRAWQELHLSIQNLSGTSEGSELLTYAIATAAAKQDEKQELYLIKTSLIQLPFLHNDRLQRFFEIAAPEDVTDITDALRLSAGAGSVEKFWTFLMASGQYDELFTLLRNEKNSFNLLHEMAMHKLPAPGDELLHVYCRQLETAFSHSPYESQKERLVKKLSALMKGLSAPDNKKMITRLSADILYLLKQQYKAAKNSIL